eukprot:1633286-Pleurochrysis_carterae.AAC.12
MKHADSLCCLAYSQPRVAADLWDQGLHHLRRDKARVQAAAAQHQRDDQLCQVQGRAARPLCALLRRDGRLHVAQTGATRRAISHKQRAALLAAFLISTPPLPCLPSPLSARVPSGEVVRRFCVRHNQDIAYHRS